MSPVASSRLLAGAILVLALGDPTAACSCAPQHPQMAFCQADVVIRGRFVGVTSLSHNNSRGESVPWVRHEIKTTKIYKGFEPPADVHFVETPTLESVCGYQPPAPLKGEEYLIMAVRQGERLTVSTCSFVRPWGRVPPSQRRGISQAYGGGCACQVVPCNSMPCALSGDAQCLWTDGLLDRSWQGPQAQRLACLPRPSQGAPPGADPFCAWETLKSSLPGALLKTAQSQGQ
ncbi:metalloproteinase inhibitor 1 isoform X1 [Dermochelys coriacea]|uniref:metalloproteinase inhibitor 1 isoform X1 n=1 Tax=Dermochelys coriacea TaxID=27794 RepID=UPI0018E8610A|nr:metalloproteinase inhibitor 1 isoform X1 [Dermochelys coriacea]